MRASTFSELEPVHVHALRQFQALALGARGAGLALDWRWGTRARGLSAASLGGISLRAPLQGLQAAGACVRGAYAGWALENDA